jgi:hypothetical protein
MKKQMLIDLVNSFGGVMYLNYYGNTGIWKLKIIFVNQAEEEEKYTKMAASEDVVYEQMYDFICIRRELPTIH